MKFPSELGRSGLRLPVWLEKCHYLTHLAARAWPGGTDSLKLPLELVPEWLEMAARARPGAAAGSKWPLDPPQSRRYAKSADRVCPGQDARWVPLESALESQNARRVPLKPFRNCRMLDECSLSHPRSSKNAARAHSLEVRSLLALEMAARKILSPVLLFLASTFARPR